MWIRTQPEKAVPTLLDRLNKAMASAVSTKDKKEDDPLLLDRFQEIESQFQQLNALFPRVKHWEKALLDQFAALEHHVDKFVLATRQKDSNLGANLQIVYENMEQIKVLIPPVGLMPNLPTNWESSAQKSKHEEEIKVREVSEEWLQLCVEEGIFQSSAMADLRVSYDNLSSLRLKLCSLFFSVFPENSFIKKKPLIYWWIGEGLVPNEEVGEEIFMKLIENGVIQAYSDRPSPVVNGCKMHPWTRYMLISLAKESELFDFDSLLNPCFEISKSRRSCLVFGNENSWGTENRSNEEGKLMTIFNVNEKYLSLKSEWLSKLKRIGVLQLGRWQYSERHHIEVDSEEFLKGLSRQKHLKYLSLRGISRISTLPSCIVDLLSLEILDLRACHNLEILPSDIGSLRKLTHLDVTECYLLESMPKGLEKLSNLQVLKGFVVGNSKKTPCRIGDLAKLEKLKRLSIYIGSEAVVQEGEFSRLKEFSSLRCLTLSWGVVSPKLKENVAKQTFSFPTSLEKLDLRGIPNASVPWLKPSALTDLKKLYIRGGDLKSLDHKEKTKWKVEVLRLKFLKNLKIGFPRLREEFPCLRYLEKFQCNEIEENVYDEDIMWQVEEESV